MRPRDDVQVYLCREVVDFRKAINGLSILVEEVLALDPFSAHIFAFCNRKRRRFVNRKRSSERGSAFISDTTSA
jgi:transposase